MMLLRLVEQAQDGVQHLSSGICDLSSGTCHSILYKPLDVISHDVLPEEMSADLVQCFVRKWQPVKQISGNIDSSFIASPPQI